MSLILLQDHLFRQMDLFLCSFTSPILGYASSHVDRFFFLWEARLLEGLPLNVQYILETILVSGCLQV